MLEFIFMLTKDDATVADAREVYRTLRGTDLHYVGFKDVGASVATLRDLAAEMRDDGREVFLEVVSERPEDELRSVDAALEIGVDWLMGGTTVDAALARLAGVAAADRPRYCPFPGRVVGHPSVLEGTLEGIAASAADLTSREGVHGVDLLAYRWDGDVPALVRAVVERSRGPVIAAGSVDGAERIDALAAAGAWAFTIGGAIFDRRLPAGPSVREQVECALRLAAEASEKAGRSRSGEVPAAR